MGRKTSIYLKDEIEKQLKERSDELSSVISKDLDRFYALLKRSLKQVSVNISANEAVLIVDSLNGSLFDANSAPLLWGNIEDSIQLDGLDKKWEVDGPALVEKVKSWSEMQCMAVIDAAERFWHECPQNDIREDVKRFFLIK